MEITSLEFMVAAIVYILTSCNLHNLSGKTLDIHNCRASMLLLDKGKFTIGKSEVKMSKFEINSITFIFENINTCILFSIDEYPLIIFVCITTIYTCIITRNSYLQVLFGFRFEYEITRQKYKRC